MKTISFDIKTAMGEMFRKQQADSSLKTTNRNKAATIKWKPTVDLSCFKNNDIRGIIGDQINGHFAYLLGKAFGGEYVLSATPETSFDGLAQVVIGRDNRERLFITRSHDQRLNRVCNNRR
ncbi:hypothetical protein O9992_26225 [Vibrio lentus]|nr:hypothetical protein [Vibrio lentus]